MSNWTVSNRTVPTHRNRIPRLAAVLLAAWASVRPAAATSYVAIADEDLLDRAPIVVEGRVVTAAAAAVAGMPAIDYGIDVERVLKGGSVPGSSLTVRVPGGVRPDGLGLKLWGAPRLAEGEEALLFLEPAADGTFVLYQFMLGAFRVATLGAREVAWRDLGEAHEVSPAGKAAPADGVRDLAAFRSWLADRARGRARSANYFVAGDATGDGSEAEARAKFALITSTQEPLPFGCGETGGHPVRWFADRTGWPVTWRFQVTGQPGLEAGGIDEYQEALLAWGDDPNTPVRYLHFGGTRVTTGFVQSDGVNAVIFGDPNDEIGGTFAESGILAIGGPWFSCEVVRYAGEDFHPIVEADVILEDGIETYFDSFRDPSPAAAELFAHEMGHTLGLGHSPRREALMRAEIHADGRGASLDVDDLHGSFHLYGRPNLPIDTDGSPLPFLKVPEAPSGLSASLAGFDQVRLAWTDTSTTESNFRVERRRRGELNYQLAGTAGAGREAFVDTVTPEADYTYRVIAQNGAGRSRPSGLAYVEVPPDLRPRPPSNLWTAAISQSAVRLAWQDNSEDENGFVIDLRDRDEWTRIPFVVPRDVVEVEIEGLRSGQAYDFRMSSTNELGESEVSNTSSSSTFPFLFQCTSREGRLCLAEGRFKVEVEFRASGRWNPAGAVPLTDRTGLFWFFVSTNPEVAVRQLDAPGGKELEIAVSGLTRLRYRIVVTDSLTGQVSRRDFAGEACDAQSKEVFRFPRAAGLPGPSSQRALKVADALDPLALTVTPRAAAAETYRRGDQSLCLFGGRFQAGLERTGEDGSEPPVPALAIAGAGETGFFAFDEPDEPDVVFKMLDAGSLNGRFWVFSSPPLRPASYRLTVTDTATGRSRSYDYLDGSGCVLADTASFAVE